MIRRFRAAALSAFAIGLAVCTRADAQAQKPGAGVDYVDLSAVGLPVISHGRLVNYVFVTARLILGSAAYAAEVRDKEPYLRDALVRLASRTPLNPPGDLNHIDERSVRTCLLGESARLVGPRGVVGVQVVAETPQRRLPRPASG